MQKQINGKCPTQNSNYTISITYVDSSTFERRSFEKGTFECQYNIFGDKCPISHQCPLYESAPEHLF